MSRTQEQHDIHVTVKLVVFEFVNTFLALFYVGFYLQDLKALRQVILRLKMRVLVHVHFTVYGTHHHT